MWRRYRRWITKGEVDGTKVAFDGHVSEGSLREACESCTVSVDVVDQILGLLGLELSIGGFVVRA